MNQQCHEIVTCPANERIGRCMLDEGHVGRHKNQWDLKLEELMST